MKPIPDYLRLDFDHSEVLSVRNCKPAPVVLVTTYHRKVRYILVIDRTLYLTAFQRFLSCKSDQQGFRPVSVVPFKLEGRELTTADERHRVVGWDSQPSIRLFKVETIEGLSITHPTVTVDEGALEQLAAN
jgi:hypothetical protein